MIIVLIPGGYHTFILFRILIGSEGYTYKLIPDLAD